MSGVPDAVVLAHFGIGASAFLGGGGEATVYVLDADRVLRVPRADISAELLDARRALIDAVRAPAPFALPEVLEHDRVAGRAVVIERRLPGRDALAVLGEDGTDRTALVRSHLDAASAIAALPCPSLTFGEVWGPGAITSHSFGAWAVDRLGASLEAGGTAFRHVDARAVTHALVDALREPEPDPPVLVHLDAYLGNMLADDDHITAVLDFGPMTIGGPRHLDPLVAAAYLAPEITPTVAPGDRDVAERWLEERGLLDALGPAERWIAAYWSGAVDDQHLQGWCRRILGAG